jgi:hypothetical protein
MTDEERRKRIDSERCLCGHTFRQHEKPKGDVPWDICSFPCRHCDCQEFDEGAAARAGAR